METSITVSGTPLQYFLAIVFNVWIIVAPIVIIRKLNYLTALLHAQFEPEDNEASGNRA